MDNEVKVVQLGGVWPDCPTWWKNMVTHLVRTNETAHNMSWDHLNRDQIINEYLHEKYGAQYVGTSHVTFPSESEYCACVLEWS